MNAEYTISRWMKYKEGEWELKPIFTFKTFGEALDLLLNITTSGDGGPGLLYGAVELSTHLIG